MMQCDSGENQLDANLQVSETSLLGLVSYTSKGMLESKRGIHI